MDIDYEIQSLRENQQKKLVTKSTSHCEIIAINCTIVSKEDIIFLKISCLANWVVRWHTFRKRHSLFSSFSGQRYICAA